MDVPSGVTAIQLVIVKQAVPVSGSGTFIVDGVVMSGGVGATPIGYAEAIHSGNFAAQPRIRIYGPMDPVVIINELNGSQMATKECGSSRNMV